MSTEGLEKFCQTLVGLVPGAQKTFKNSAMGIRIEIITTGEFPGDGKPKAISFPNPQAVAVELGGLMVIDLKNLIELKLASGLSAPDRLKDLADIQELIRSLNLPLSIIEQLDPSVQPEYLRLWVALQK